MTFLIVFTGTNQEIFFDRSKFISVVFLVFSLVFSYCVSVFLGILPYLIYYLCQFLNRNYHSITKKSRAISSHRLFPPGECKQTWLPLNFVPTIDFTSSQLPGYEKRKWDQLWVDLRLELSLICFGHDILRDFRSATLISCKTSTERV